MGYPWIEPLGRAVQAVQPGPAALVSASSTLDRAARPSAAAIAALAGDLAQGEHLSPAEVRHILALVGTALEVFTTSVPGAPPAQGAGVLLEAVDLVRALHNDLTQQQEVFTSLAPALQELLATIADNGSLPAGAAPDPTAAGQQAAAAGDNAPAGTQLLGAAAERPGAPSGAAACALPPAPSLAKLVACLDEAVEAIHAALLLGLLRAASPPAAPGQPAPTAGPACSTPASVPQGVLRALVQNIKQLQVLLPPGSMPAPLARALSEAIVLVRALALVRGLVQTVGPESAAPAAAKSDGHRVAGSARFVDSGVVGSQSPAPVTPVSKTTPATLAAAIARIIACLDDPPAAAQRLTVARNLPTPAAPGPLPTSSPAAPGASSAAPPGSLAAVKLQLQTILESVTVLDSTPRLDLAVAPQSAVTLQSAGANQSPAGLESAAALQATVVRTGAGWLQSVALLKSAGAVRGAPFAPGAGRPDFATETIGAQLRAAATGAPTAHLEPFDPFRWGLVNALNYRPARARPSPRTGARDRCGLCNRLLAQTPDGELRCMSCFQTA